MTTNIITSMKIDINDTVLQKDDDIILDEDDYIEDEMDELMDEDWINGPK